MKSNAGCWRLRLTALVIAMSFLGGCGTGSSEPRVGACPPVVKYSQAEQVQAAGEIETLPEGAVVVTMLTDYAVMREQASACLGSQPSRF